MTPTPLRVPRRRSGRLRHLAGVATALLLATLGVLGGCGVSPEPLMPTPLLYQHGALDLHQLTPESRRSTTVDLFFATNRRLESSRDGTPTYGNEPSPTVNVGMATVRLGDERLSWEELSDASRSERRQAPVVLDLAAFREHATLADPAVPVHAAPLSAEQRAWFEALNAHLAASPSPELVIYVHGAKVDFYNGCAFSAEIAHFLGRRLVPMAFCWPTHQHIFAYMAGEDIGRANVAATALAGLLIQLAEHSTARRIHVISWSAGGRVASRAIALLRAAFPQLDRAELQQRFRIGVVAFAAADVEVPRFLGRLHAIDDVAERVIVTVSDDDLALSLSQALLGGDARLGVMATGDVAARETLETVEHVEILDVSAWQAARGFDIHGHRYWFNNTWASSDLLLAILFDLPAAERGLVPGPAPCTWGLDADYPRRVEAAVEAALEPAVEPCGGGA